MKKLLALVLSLLLVLPAAALAEETVDTFTSASVANFYGQYALTGDELMNAVNDWYGEAIKGTYLICTTNPDGSPNAAVFIFGIKKLNDKYYIQLGLADNQSKQNLARTGEGLAVFGFANEGNTFGTGGARFYFEAIEDQAITDELMKDARAGQLYFEITKVLPLG